MTVDSYSEMTRIVRMIWRNSSRLWRFFIRLAQEPPFRIFARAAIKACSNSIRTKADWDAVVRPHYLMGVVTAADQAIREGVSAISVIEFGVASGEGLLALEEYAAKVEQETHVKIAVYGFDTGAGLPTMSGDYRDHPDQWKIGDYPMDQQSLRRRLGPRAVLVLGDVAQTVPRFVQEIQRSPIGFISVDVDLYSSTKEVLQIFLLPVRRMLRRVVIYFDDVDCFFNHRFAGELLAIEEFNEISFGVKIDRWRGIVNGRVFAESPWLQKMYVAHDLQAISKVTLGRRAALV